MFVLLPQLKRNSQYCQLSFKIKIVLCNEAYIVNKKVISVRWFISIYTNAKLNICVGILVSFMMNVNKQIKVTFVLKWCKMKSSQFWPLVASITHHHSCSLFKLCHCQGALLWHNICPQPPLEVVFINAFNISRNQIQPVSISCFTAKLKCFLVAFFNKQAQALHFYEAADWLCVTLFFLGDAESNANHRRPHCPCSEHYRAHSFILGKSRCYTNMQTTL